MLRAILFITILYCTSVIAQVDSLDTVFLKNGDTVKGKVLLIKQDAIDFIDQSTNIQYEYNKSVIKFITLKTGKTIWFNKDIENLPTKPVNIDDEQGLTRVAAGLGYLYVLQNDNFDAGSGIDFFLKVRFPSIISLMFNLGYYTADTKVDFLSKANTSFVMPELCLLLEAKKGSVQPYAGAGFGYYNIDNTVDDQVVQFFQSQGFNLKEEIESGIGFNIRGGLNVLFNEKVGMFFDMKYLIFNSKAKVTVSRSYPYQEATIESDFKLNNLSFVVGLLVSF